MIRKIRHIFISLLITILILCTLPFIKSEPLAEKPRKKLNVNKDNANNIKVKIIDKQEDALNYRLRLIDQAKDSIYLSTYNINVNDRSSKEILSRLTQAAKRGVAVNLVLDAKFGGLNKKNIKELSESENFNVYTYNPINFKNPQSLQVSLHSKILLIDQEWIISGGRNISNTFLTDDLNLSNISYDLDLLIYDKSRKSELVIDTKLFFIDLINSPYTLHKNKDKRSSMINESVTIDNKIDLEDIINEMYSIDSINLLTSSLTPVKKTSRIASDLYDLAETTPGKVYILSPYLVISEKLYERVKDLGNKTDISILTNSLYSSLNFPAYSNYLKNRDKISKLNLRIYEYLGNKNTSVHTKAIILGDNLGSIGSLNIDNRSLFINVEQMIVVKGEKFHSNLMDIINDQIDNSEVVKRDYKNQIHDKDASLLKRFLMKVSGYIFYPFQYFL